MAVSTLNTSTGAWYTISGTLQEIIDELANQNMSGHNVVGFLHDGTNYVVLACRRGA